MMKILKCGILMILFGAVTLSGAHQFYFQPAPVADSMKITDRQKESLTFQCTAKHSFISFKFAEAKDAGDHSCLSFTLDSPVPGKITLFYWSSDMALISIDTRIEIIPGKNEYEIDLSKQKCGREYRSKDIPEYRKFGAADGKISGLRIDFWFPPGTEVTVSKLALDKPSADDKKGGK